MFKISKASISSWDLELRSTCYFVDKKIHHMMFKRKGGGGQRPFEQCSKKLHFSLVMASLIGKIRGKTKWSGIDISCGHILGGWHFDHYKFDLDFLKSKIAKVISQQIQRFLSSGKELIAIRFLIQGDLQNHPNNGSLFCIFCPRGLKLIELGLQYVDSRFFYFQNSRTKITKVKWLL